jgi:hypothetical protein
VNIAIPWLLANLITVAGQGVSLLWPYLFGYVSLRCLQTLGGLPAFRNVRQTCLSFPSNPVNLDTLYSGSLDPRDAMLGLWYVTHMETQCSNWSLISIPRLSFHYPPHLPFSCHAHHEGGEELRIIERFSDINNTVQVRASFYPF